MATYYVYILTNKSGTLYVGMTNNIERRLYEHRQKLISGFSSKYNIDRLVYVETFSSAGSAIEREKQVKHWRREKKLKLIDSLNPQRNDISQNL